jgi:hypothetical protein
MHAYDCECVPIDELPEELGDPFEYYYGGSD